MQFEYIYSDSLFQDVSIPEGAVLRYLSSINGQLTQRFRDHQGVKSLSGSNIQLAVAVSNPDAASGTVQVRPVTIGASAQQTQWAGPAQTAFYTFSVPSQGSDSQQESSSSSSSSHLDPPSPIPTEGLLLHAALVRDEDTCATGQTITKYGNVQFGLMQGWMPCAKFQGNGYLDFPAISHLTGNNPFTISWWEKIDTSLGGSGYVWQFGTGADDRCVGGGNWLYYNGGYIGGGALPQGLHFCCITYDGSTLSYYINNSLNGSTSVSSPNNQNTLRLGSGAGQYYGGYLKAFRIYNRALSSTEIGWLYDEFDV